MVQDFFYGKIPENNPDGSGAHKTANTIIPIYASFLFLVSGDMSSSGFALGFLADITKIKIAMSQ